jgi:hypothetical protein
MVAGSLSSTMSLTGRSSSTVRLRAPTGPGRGGEPRGAQPERLDRASTPWAQPGRAGLVEDGHTIPKPGVQLGKGATGCRRVASYVDVMAWVAVIRRDDGARMMAHPPDRLTFTVSGALAPARPWRAPADHGRGFGRHRVTPAPEPASADQRCAGRPPRRSPADSPGQGECRDSRRPGLAGLDPFGYELAAAHSRNGPARGQRPTNRIPIMPRTIRCRASVVG